MTQDRIQQASARKLTPGTGATGKLSIEKLTKRFGEYLAVQDVNFTVEPGSILALLGPSGCGKTTTLRCIAGLETPTSGRIAVDDEALFDSRQTIYIPAEKRGIGLVFQSYALWPHMTVRQNVEYGLKVQGVTKDERDSRVDDVLKRLELTARADSYPGTLSGGQQQRVALGRSLVLEPKVLLCDEPLSNLDAKLRELLRNDLRQIIKSVGLTAVHVTHDQIEAMALADEVIVMNGGRIEQRGVPWEIYRAPRTRFTADFMGSTNFFSGEVTTVRDDSYDLSAGTGILLKTLSCGRQIMKGEQRSVSIRPEDVLIVPIDGATSEDGRKNVISGTITEVIFLGAYTAFDVECADGIKVKVHKRNYDAFTLGSTVLMELPADRLISLEG
jgi:iron(III) transport system ATP-binding protein